MQPGDEQILTKAPAKETRPPAILPIIKNSPSDANPEIQDQNRDQALFIHCDRSRQQLPTLSQLGA